MSATVPTHPQPSPGAFSRRSALAALLGVTAIGTAACTSAPSGGPAQFLLVFPNRANEPVQGMPTVLERALVQAAAAPGGAVVKVVVAGAANTDPRIDDVDLTPRIGDGEEVNGSARRLQVARSNVTALAGALVALQRTQRAAARTAGADRFWATVETGARTGVGGHLVIFGSGITTEPGVDQRAVLASTGSAETFPDPEATVHDEVRRGAFGGALLDGFVDVTLVGGGVGSGAQPSPRGRATEWQAALSAARFRAAGAATFTALPADPVPAEPSTVPAGVEGAGEGTGTGDGLVTPVVDWPLIEEETPDGDTVFTLDAGRLGFGPGSAELDTTRADPLLAVVAARLRAAPDLVLSVEARTTNWGDLETYQLPLSRRRAEAVTSRLVEHHQVARTRIASVTGVGSTRNPAGSNLTDGVFDEDKARAERVVVLTLAKGAPAGTA